LSENARGGQQLGARGPIIVPLDAYAAHRAPLERQGNHLFGSPSDRPRESIFRVAFVGSGGAERICLTQRTQSQKLAATGDDHRHEDVDMKDEYFIELFGSGFTGDWTHFKPVIRRI
jgi:hypothetical protein